MANRNSSNNSTDRTLRTVLLVLLAALMLAYAFIATYKHEANPGKWWPNNTVEQPDKGGDDANAGNSGLIAGDEVKSGGVTFMKTSIPVELYEDYGVSAVAETALQLTVTPTNSGADLSDGAFSIKFKNASSTWASGKTLSQYATLSQSDSTHATVSCLQAFGEQIIVVYTYTGESNNEIKTMTAEYPLDYAKRLVSENILNAGLKFNGSSLTNSTLSYSKYLSVVNPSFEIDLSILGAAAYSDYTIDDTFTISVSSTFNLLDEFKSACQSAGITLAGANKTGSVSGGKLNTTDGSSTILDYYFGDVYKTAAFRSVAASNSAFKLTIVYSGTYSSYTYSTNMSISLDGAPQAAQGVQFQDSGHVF